MKTRNLPIGAEVTPEGVHFRVWAPSRQRVEVVFEEASEEWEVDFELTANVANRTSDGVQQLFREQS